MLGGFRSKLSLLVVLLATLSFLFKTAASTEALAENEMNSCLVSFGKKTQSQREDILSSAWMSLSLRERADVVEVSI